MEGHNGIYEVSVGEVAFYTNQKACTQGFPTDELIFRLLEEATGFKPITDPAQEVQEGMDEGPACSVDAGPES